MATEVIKISKQAESTGLYLTDNEGHAGNNSITTKVKAGDTVTWQLKPNGGIDQITGITEKSKSGNVNVFSTPPVPINPQDPKSPWQGVIKQDAKGTEAYSIEYMIKGVSFTDDPDIEVDDDKAGEN